MKGVVDTISKIKCLTCQIWYFYINIFDSNCKDIPSYEMMLNNLVFLQNLITLGNYNFPVIKKLVEKKLKLRDIRKWGHITM